MKELYIDFDGVIMDTIPFLYNALEKSKININDEDAKRKFFAKYDFSKIINDDNILNDSITAIKKLKESNLFQLHILTHVNSLEEGTVKVQYIRRYFDDITIILTPKKIEKTDMVHAKDAILVDDYSGNLRIWKGKGGIPIRFNSELEVGEFKTINSLEQLIEIFGENNECESI